jgi:hypothetical protein
MLQSNLLPPSPSIIHNTLHHITQHHRKEHYNLNSPYGRHSNFCTIRPSILSFSVSGTTESEFEAIKKKDVTIIYWCKFNKEVYKPSSEGGKHDRKLKSAPSSYYREYYLTHP